MEQRKEIKISSWIEKLLSEGKNAFSLNFLRQELPYYSEIAIKRALNRLSLKGKTVSVFKGYYLIISPQYAARGILPPALFIDGLMKYLNKSYYVGLINAAAFHGAAHQQPQEFFVFTESVVLRPIQKKGIKIHFISISSICHSWLMDVKTETGYLKVSNPLLTAIDLIRYEKRIGGLSRAAIVIEELSEVIDPETINSEMIDSIPLATWQRLGYILDVVLDKPTLAEAILSKLQLGNKNLYRIPLKASGEKKDLTVNEKWNIVINASIETDF